MQGSKRFNICWILVAFLPCNWSTRLIGNSGFVTSNKKDLTANKSATSLAMLEILRNDVRKVQSAIDGMAQEFGKLEPFFSHLKESLDTNSVNEKVHFQPTSSSHNILNDSNATKNLPRLWNTEIFRDKLERVGKIQERNSRLLLIQMTSLIGLEEGLNRLGNLINSAGSILNSEAGDSSLSNYQQQVVRLLSSIDKKLYSISLKELGSRERNSRDEDSTMIGRKNEEALKLPAVKPASKNSDGSKRTVRNCESLPKNKNYTSGIYSLDRNDIATMAIWGNVSLIYCDLDRDGRGWTVVQRRGGPYGGRVNFNRPWSDYSNGFGDLNAEFWFGNEIVHRMTFYDGHYQLRIELEDWNGQTAWAQYSNFQLGSRMDNYRIKVSGYTGNATDSLSAHYSTPFSTYDRRNDFAPECCPCALDYGGGWWYYSCFEANLNGNYYRINQHREPYRGIIWEHWRDDYSLKSTKMMIRAKNRTPSE